MKSWLTIASCSGSGHYRHTENAGKSLILPIPRPITPRFPSLSPHESQRHPHGRTFPVQEHHAPQGPAGCAEVEVVQQAGAGNHRRGQDGPARSQHERAVKKASGGDAENYAEIRYEGYGPGGVAVIVEALTDTRNRAASDIRSFF